MTDNLFSDAEAPTTSLFEGEGEAAPESPTNSVPNRITPRLIAAAENPNSVMALTQDAIDQAEAAVASGAEFGRRLKVAADRQARQMQRTQAGLAKLPGAITTTESLRQTDEIYSALASQRVEDNARASVERQAIENIQDDLSAGNSVEAKLTYDLMFKKGTATKVWYDESAKNLVLAQKVAALQQESADESFLGKTWNFFADWIPFNYNFSRAGVTPGSKTSIKNFFLAGTNLQSQSEEFWNKYRTPEELADALKDGGEADLSLRSNATTLGGFDPAKASELLEAINYQSESDRMWANGWGLAEPAFVAPWGRITSIPKGLARIGSRTAMNRAVASAYEDMLANGVKATEKASAMSEREVVENLETSGMSPLKATPNFVPPTVDVSTRIEAARQFAETELPRLLQTSRATAPDEIAHAYEAGIREIEKQTGRSVKDVTYHYENVATGQRFDYKPGDALPEQGNVVYFVEVTFGKKEGGLFAKAQTAVSQGLSKLGIRGEAVADIAGVTERRVPDPDFNIVAFHGTADVFDQFSKSELGKMTGARSAKMGHFFVNNADVAWGYAVAAAKDKAVSLAEAAGLKKALDDAGEAAKEYRALKVHYTEGNGWEPAVMKQLDGKVREASDNYRKFKDETSVSQQNIRPVALRLKNPYVHDYADEMFRSYDEKSYSEIIAKAKADGHDGVILKNTDDSIGPLPSSELPGTKKNFSADAPTRETISAERYAAYNNHDVIVVFDEANIKPTWDAFTVDRDISGGFALKARFNISEDGFRTTPLDTKRQGLFSWARSDARRVDTAAHNKAVAGGAARDAVEKAITKRLRESKKGLSGVEEARLDEIVKKGQNGQMWLDDDTFTQLYERVANGEAPSEKVLSAYKEFQLANDVIYNLWNDELYKGLATRGYENVSFDLGQTGLRIDGNARVSLGGSRPTERVFNSTDNVHYGPRNPLTQEEWDRLSGEGYLLVDVKDGVSFPDGAHMRKVLVHRSEIERSPLKREQLGYVAGGRQVYTGKHFVKQVVRGKQPDTGSEFLKNPNVFRTGDNPNRLSDWAKVFNKAIDDFHERGIVDPQHYDDNVFANLEGLSFPSGEDFVREASAGRIGKDHVEVVGDRELPRAYRTSADAENFVDEESSVGGYFRSTGQLFTSRRGEGLLDESGKLAETVDPWEATNTALSKIAKLSSMSSYKDNVLDRFRATFKDHIEGGSANRTASDLVNARVSKETEQYEPELARKIRAEQAAIKRTLNFETGFERASRLHADRIGAWILGDARGGVREKAADAWHWLEKKHPVNFIRGMAFDAKLGLFNVGQFFLQSQTMLAATALSPRHGLKGMMTAAPLTSYILSKGNENVLDVFAKRGLWKVASFESEQEFKDFARLIYRTGFGDPSSTHLSINDFRPNRVFGAAAKVEAIREKGRVFFNMAEMMNRATSGRIAWEELKAAGVPFGSAEFRERFIGLADDYSFNMTHESSAAFQRGLLSIPTQFWGYNVRMMDAMFGSRFTREQRARLILQQFALYGAGGVPLLEAVQEWRHMQGDGSPIDVGTLESVIDRGIYDNAIYALTGADVRVGERLGTGTFLTETAKNTGIAGAINAVTDKTPIGDLFSINEFNKKSVAEMAGGATFAIAGDGLSTIGDVARYAIGESGVDLGSPLQRETYLKLADNVSTVSNAHKAWLAYNYGVARSNKGTILANDLPSADAFWMALGLGRPQELEDLGLMKEALDRQKDIVDEAAGVVRNWRQEAFTVPDKYDENLAKVNAYVKLLPPDIQTEVLRRTNRTMDKSFYDHIQKLHEKEANK